MQIQSAPRAFAALRKDGAVFAWGDQTSGWDGMNGGVVLIESCVFFGFPQKNVGPKISVFPRTSTTFLHNFHNRRSFVAVLVIFGDSDRIYVQPVFLEYHLHGAYSEGF